VIYDLLKCDINHKNGDYLILTFENSKYRMRKTRDNKNDKCEFCHDKSCATEKLGQDELDLISNNRYVSDIKKKTTVLNSGSPISHIIYLRSGLVKEFVIGSDGKEQIIQIILPHSYLGLSSLFGDKTNHFSYTALTDLKVCYIDIDVFTKMIKRNGNFAFEILSSVGRESLHNFHRFITQNHKNSFGRVADLLLYFSRVVFSSKRFLMPLSRQEIAEMVGISRESTGRVLSKFNSEGLIKISGKKVVIIEIRKLDKISRLG
jgi:CRP-like cAMP-binding protein